MTSPGGQWVRVRFADGGDRLDWIPQEQAPSPDGSVGLWHVVPDPAGGESRWEWHPRAAPAALPPALWVAAAPTSVFAAPSAPPEPAPAVPGDPAMDPAVDPAGDPDDSPTSIFLPIAPGAIAPLEPATSSVPDPDPSITQPLPLQAVPHRPGTRTAPSVFPAPAATGRVRGSRGAGTRMRGRVAAATLCVVLAAPVVYLLAQHSTDSDPVAATAQTDRNPNADEAATSAGALGAGATDPGSAAATDSVTGTPTTGAASAAATDSVTGTPTTGAASAAATALAGQQYLSHLHDLDATEGYTFTALGDSALLSDGNTACADLDNGSTYEAVRQAAMLKLPNGGQILVAAATTYLCPRHHAELVAYTAQQQPAPSGGSSWSTAGHSVPGPPSQDTGTTTAPDSASG